MRPGSAIGAYLPPEVVAGGERNAYLKARGVVERLCALLILLLLAPMMLAILVFIRLGSEGPGLFWSQRIGRDGRPFAMPKFRTMYAGTALIPRERMGGEDDPVTPLGAWLRRWSLDELPQLWSILTGEMAFIGPRPLIPEDEAQQARQELGINGAVLPGLTGLAQINGRNLVGPRAKARYDVFYGRHICLALDLMILRRTIGLVLRGTGIW